MRIGIFSDTYIPQINGVSTSIEMLKRSLEKKGHQVFIVTINNSTMKYVYEDKLIRIPGVPVGIFDYRLTSIYPARAIKTIKNWNLDVIHSQTEFGIGSFARILGKQFNIPVVHTYHTSYEEIVDYVTKGFFENSSKKAAEYFAKFYCDKTVSELIVPTKKTYDLFKDKYKVKRNIYIVPTGVEIERYNPNKFNKNTILKLKEKIGLKQNDVILLYVGRLGYEKNIQYLINNHANIVKKNPNCKLVIVGDGPEKEKLMKLVTKNKITNNVIFTGKVSLEEVGLYYQLGDIFVTASLAETQGLTVLEALAAYLPCVVIKDDSYKDAIIDGINGFMFKNKKNYIDIINDLVSNKEKRLFMANEAGASSLNHSASVFGDRVLKVYRLAIGEKNVPKNFLDKIMTIIKDGFHN
ncbi:MAG: glycosyltransferase [Bacilli bacterium]